MVVAQPAQEWAWALSLFIQRASILSIIIIWLLAYALGSPGGSVIKNLSANAGDLDSVSGLGRSLGRGNGNPLQYSCLENSMDRGAGQAAAHGDVKNQT